MPERGDQAGGVVDPTEGHDDEGDGARGHRPTSGRSPVAAVGTAGASWPAPEEHGVDLLEQGGRDDAERAAHDHVAGQQDVADRAGVAQPALDVPLVGQHPPAAAPRDHAVAGVEQHERLVEVLGAGAGGEHPREQVVVLHVAQVGVAPGVEGEPAPEDDRGVVDRVVQAHPLGDLLVGARVATHPDDVLGGALELEHRRPDQVEVVLLDGGHLTLEPVGERDVVGVVPGHEVTGRDVEPMGRGQTAADVARQPLDAQGGVGGHGSGERSVERSGDRAVDDDEELLGWAGLAGDRGDRPLQLLDRGAVVRGHQHGEGGRHPNDSRCSRGSCRARGRWPTGPPPRAG